MFIAGLVLLVVSIAFVFAGNSAKKAGNVQGGTVSILGKAGIVAGILLLVGSGIRIIGPGEVGVLDLFGKVSDNEIHSGVNLVNPLMRVHSFSIKTQEMKETMVVPSKEGLQVDLDVSVLYKMKPDAASDIFRTIGPNFESIVILPMFRSAVRGVSVNYDAKSLYTSGREIIAKALFDSMQESLEERGFIVENVLIRGIKLPSTLTSAIEDKLKADQEAQRMEFVLEKSKLQAEQKRIEAVGIKDANKIIAEGLTDSYIRWYRIEMLKELVNSPNNTIIIIPEDLKSVPMIMNSN
ncbi:prohibitin family protein [Candidatus Latescibacterota bacterium]